MKSIDIKKLPSSLLAVRMMTRPYQKETILKELQRRGDPRYIDHEDLVKRAENVSKDIKEGNGDFHRKKKLTDIAGKKKIANLPDKVLREIVGMDRKGIFAKGVPKKMDMLNKILKRKGS